MLNWFDLIVLISLLAAFVDGYRKGLIMMLVGLATVVLAAVFAGRVAVNIKPHLEGVVDLSPQALHVLSYALAFLAIAAVVSLAGMVIQKLFESVNLNFINRLAGSVVSIGTTAVVLSILLNLVLMLDVNERLINHNKESFSTTGFVLLTPHRAISRQESGGVCAGKVPETGQRSWQWLRQPAGWSSSIPTSRRDISQPIRLNYLHHAYSQEGRHYLNDGILVLLNGLCPVFPESLLTFILLFISVVVMH